MHCRAAAKGGIEEPRCWFSAGSAEENLHCHAPRGESKTREGDSVMVNGEGAAVQQFGFARPLCGNGERR